MEARAAELLPVPYFHVVFTLPAEVTDIAYQNKRVKDYRASPGKRWRTMTLHSQEFLRRLLTHVLPKGLHRIRHYGLFASAMKVENLAQMRRLLGVPEPEPEELELEEVAANEDEPSATDGVLPQPCPC